MKPPTRLQYPIAVYVGPAKTPYQIDFVTGKKWLGKTVSHKKSRIIKLNADQPDSQIFMTFVHELLHAIEFESGQDISHDLIYLFEEGLVTFFMNNLKNFEFHEVLSSHE